MSEVRDQNGNLQSDATAAARGDMATPPKKKDDDTPVRFRAGPGSTDRRRQKRAYKRHVMQGGDQCGLKTYLART